MNSHWAARATGKKVLVGFSFCIVWRMPVSVATRNVFAVDSRARLTIPLVEATKSACLSAPVKQPHSGWTNSSAPGCARRSASRSASLMLKCTWQDPGHRWIDRPVFSRTNCPRYMSGRNKISLSADTDCTTRTALEEVQQ
jgi:hypothetical protein